MIIRYLTGTGIVLCLAGGSAAPQSVEPTRTQERTLMAMRASGSIVVDGELGWDLGGRDVGAGRNIRIKPYVSTEDDWR